MADDRAVVVAPAGRLAGGRMKTARTARATPKAEECIAYQIPTFRLGGRVLVSFGAWTTHCAFYAGSSPMEVHKYELKAYDTSKGTIRFLADKPLPATLVRKLVKTQIAARGARRG